MKYYRLEASDGAVMYVAGMEGSNPLDFFISFYDVHEQEHIVERAVECPQSELEAAWAAIKPVDESLWPTPSCPG